MTLFLRLCPVPSLLLEILISRSLVAYFLSSRSIASKFFEGTTLFFSWMCFLQWYWILTAAVCKRTKSFDSFSPNCPYLFASSYTLWSKFCAEAWEATEDMRASDFFICLAVRVGSSDSNWSDVSCYLDAASMESCWRFGETVIKLSLPGIDWFKFL